MLRTVFFFSCRHLICLLVLTAALVLPCGARAQTHFVRGDSNGTGEVDISDAVFTLIRLFVSGEPFPCKDAADANDDGGIDLSDAVTTLAYQFLGGAAPPPPFPDCGPDASPGDALGCERSPDASCAAPPSSSPIVAFLEALSLDGTEPCCLPGLGLQSVRAGKCESLGGSPAGDAGCIEAPGPVPGLVWRQVPPVTPVDALFSVDVLPTGKLDFDDLTLDLYRVEAGGETTGPIRIENALTDLAGIDSGWMVHVGGLPEGDYTLRVTAWKRSVVSDGEVSFLVGGVESPPATRGVDVPVFVLDLPGGFRAHPTAAAVLSLADVAELASHAPAGDPLMASLVTDLHRAEGQLRAVQASLSSPLIDGIRSGIRSLESERGAAQDEAARATAERDGALGRVSDLQRELEALTLVNRYLDTYFGPEELKALKELIKRREEILAGAAQDDRQALADALAGKRDRLAEVDKALADKKAKLEQMKKDHAALQKRIREQFHTTRRTLGDNMGKINVTDETVSYDITGILVTGGGTGYILYAPYGKEYKAEKEKLDALIEEYEELWKTIQACEKEIADLEKEKAWLEGNIAKLENGAGEVDEIDSILDEYFRIIAGGGPQAPHLEELLRRLRETGNGWLADLLEQLFGSVPRTCDELEEFERSLQALRDAKHAREAEIEDEIRRAEEEARAAEARREEAERRRQEIEDEIRRREEALRQAEEEARRAEEEEYRRRQAAAEEEARRRQADEELKERIRQLRERAAEGDESALAELAGLLLGLTLLDELLPNLPLGSMVGGLLTLAEMPECACEILKAMLELFADQGHFRTVLANEVIRLFRECAGLPHFSSVEIGAEQLAQAVDRMSRGARQQVCEALQRAIRLRCP